MASLLNKWIPQQVRARPRLIISILVGFAVAGLLPHGLAANLNTRLLVGWNAMACLYLALGGFMMARSSQQSMTQRARLQDDGKWAILLLVIAAAVASLAAIVVELGVAKDMQGPLKYGHIGLAAFTILSSWAFTHMMFALH